MTISQNSHLTFKGNVGAGRHDWLRLTPAYSYNLVKETLLNADPSSVVLDPFSGTGTTGLVAAEYGMRAKMLDLNPFLVWFAQTKCRNYSPDDINAARKQSIASVENARSYYDRTIFVPPMHRIERWWNSEVLHNLARLKCSISDSSANFPGYDLLLVAFCRVMIALSNVSFNHQSMSFRKESASQYGMFDQRTTADEVFERFLNETQTVLSSVSDDLSGEVVISLDDARCMKSVSSESIDTIYTSPPYSNRMSYIRELRPYMYWLGYLTSGRQAGEIDWKTIGGTWGSATSRLSKWDSTIELPIEDEFRSVLNRIASNSNPNADILANYVHKYFYDMYAHFKQAYRVVKSGGLATYIVGNSTFYGNIVPTERWYADLLSAAGFENIEIRTIRKRNSNRELYEFKVTAVRP